MLLEHRDGVEIRWRTEGFLEDQHGPHPVDPVRAKGVLGVRPAEQVPPPMADDDRPRFDLGEPFRPGLGAVADLDHPVVRTCLHQAGGGVGVRPRSGAIGGRCRGLPDRLDLCEGQQGPCRGALVGLHGNSHSGSRTSGTEISMLAMTNDTVLDTTITEPSMTAGEVEMMLFALDRSRAQFAWKVGGLDSEALHRAHPPSAMTLAWIIKHLAFVDDWTAVRLAAHRPRSSTGSGVRRPRAAVPRSPRSSPTGGSTGR